VVAILLCAAWFVRYDVVGNFIAVALVRRDCLLLRCGVVEGWRQEWSCRMEEAAAELRWKFRSATRNRSRRRRRCLRDSGDGFVARSASLRARWRKSKRSSAMLIFADRCPYYVSFPFRNSVLVWLVRKLRVLKLNLEMVFTSLFDGLFYFSPFLF